PLYKVSRWVNASSEKAAGAAGSAIRTASLGAPAFPPSEMGPTRALFRRAAWGVSTLAGVGPHPELAELSAADLSRMLRAAELTSLELIQMSLERIQAIDGDKTRSVIEINPDALDIARRRDREQRRGKVRGPLHGLPVLVKD